MKEFLILAEPFNSDLLTGMLWNLNITGINEEVNCLKVFSESVDIVEIESLLTQMVNNKLLRKYSVEENYVEEKNWNEEWERSRNVIKVSDRITVKPTFRKYDAEENEIVLTIDPKMSFGTGEHQTTKLVLRQLEESVLPGMKVLDIGTGTGILAIASVKLGASHAIGNDIDEWCYENSIENSQLNNTSDKTDFRTCTVDQIPERDFDMIIANIQKNILLEIAGDIRSRTRKNGIVLLSGLLHHDEFEISDHYEGSGFTKIETIRMDEWISIKFVLRS